MGLDIVELFIAVEGAFGIDIPDSEAARLETPRLLIGYLERQLRVADVHQSSCTSQRAFYRARSAVVRRFGLDRNALRPESRLADVLGNRRGEWQDLGRDMGATVWPRLRSDWRMLQGLGGVTTLGDLAENLSIYNVAALREPATPWTSGEIEAIVRSLIERELGVDMSMFTLDSQFTFDMGCG